MLAQFTFYLADSLSSNIFKMCTLNFMVADIAVIIKLQGTIRTLQLLPGFSTILSWHLL